MPIRPPDSPEPGEQKIVAVTDVMPERSLIRHYPSIDRSQDESDTFAYVQTYWRILRKRFPVIATTTLAVVFLTAFYSFRAKPVYEATAQVEVEAETPEFQSLSELYRTMPTDTAFLQTQVEILTSDDLAWETAKQLNLDRNPEFVGPGNKGAPVDPAELRSRLTRAFKQHLHADLKRDSRMITVSFESTDRNLAPQAANDVVNNYVQGNFRRRYDSTRQVSAWMETQLDELKSKVEKSAQALVDYEKRNAIANVSDKENVVQDRLSDLSKDLTQAEADRASKQSLYESIKTDPSKTALLVNDELLQQLESKSSELSGQYTDALAQSGPNYPKVVALGKQVQQQQSLIDNERKRIIARIQDDYLASVRREEILSSAVSQQKVQVEQLSQLLIQYGILKREAETNQQLYDDLLKQLKNATISAGLRATNVHLIDEATMPSRPIRPDKTQNIGIGMLVGLVLGVIFAFVQHGLDDTVKTPEDLEQIVGVPALATIPSLGSRGPRYGGYGYGYGYGYGSARRKRTAEEQQQNQTDLAISAGKLETVVVSHPTSRLAESYRILRTSVLLSMAPQPPQVVLVTSSQPSEGKTCTSVNLALGLAQRGSRVVIVDADLRRPTVGRALGVTAPMGLSTCLTGSHRLNEVLLRSELQPNLWVVPAGPVPPNPSELVSSPAMQEIIVKLRQEFDHVVVDSPPLLLVTDATLLSTFVDGVILVVESGGTARGAIYRACKILDHAGAKLLGTVLNKANLRDTSYYNSRYQYYNHYYDGSAYGSSEGSSDAHDG